MTTTMLPPVQGGSVEDVRRAEAFLTDTLGMFAAFAKDIKIGDIFTAAPSTYVYGNQNYGLYAVIGLTTTYNKRGDRTAHLLIHDEDDQQRHLLFSGVHPVYIWRRK